MDVSAKIRKLVNEPGPLRAYAEIVLDGEFAVHGLRVIEGPGGIFAAMPSEAGKDRRFRDVCHPITTGLRADINRAVLEAYAKAREARA